MNNRQFFILGIFIAYYSLSGHLMLYKIDKNGVWFLLHCKKLQRSFLGFSKSCAALVLMLQSPERYFRWDLLVTQTKLGLNPFCIPGWLESIPGLVSQPSVSQSWLPGDMRGLLLRVKGKSWPTWGSDTVLLPHLWGHPHSLASCCWWWGREAGRSASSKVNI